MKNSKYNKGVRKLIRIIINQLADYLQVDKKSVCELLDNNFDTRIFNLHPRWQVQVLKNILNHITQQFGCIIEFYKSVEISTTKGKKSIKLNDVEKFIREETIKQFSCFSVYQN